MPPLWLSEIHTWPGLRCRWIQPDDDLPSIIGDMDGFTHSLTDYLCSFIVSASGRRTGGVITPWRGCLRPLLSCFQLRATAGGGRCVALPKVPCVPPHLAATVRLVTCMQRLEALPLVVVDSRAYS